jgi:phage terminase large subunit
LTTLDIETPRAFLPLLADVAPDGRPVRYRAAYGGRGSAKSHEFAEMLVERCYMRKTRAVCIREVQHSLRESVRQLVVDKTIKFGLGADFWLLEKEIRCPHGGIIIFRGMQSYNAENIKSLEDYDVAWVEEAQTLSERSLRLLRPTIRRDGSEIWFTWNPRHDSDAVDKFFRGAAPPPGTIAIQVNWNENPWFPHVLREEMAFDRDTDPEMAAHVWDGGYEIISEGSYYGRLLAQAQSQGRVGFFPHDPALPVSTAWDIGVDDYTAIWFLQQNARQVRVINYYEASGIGADQIIKEALPELIPNPRQAALALIVAQREPYRYAEHFLPHDVKLREWGGGARMRIENLMAYGMPQNSIRVGVSADPADRIDAVRRLFPYLWFYQGPIKDQGVNLGMKRIRNYRRRFNESLQTFTGPLHDENSHGCDALGEYAINSPLARIVEPPPAEKKARPGQVVLLGEPEPRRTTRIRV